MATTSGNLSAAEAACGAMTPRLYEGTKRVHATPMTNGEFAHSNGWEVAIGERPDKPGYLVEHEAPTGIIESKHAGYFRTWIPQAEFEAAFKEVAESTLPPHQQRVLDEKQCRDIEISKLDEFIQRNPLFDTLPDAEQARMKRQLDVMHELSSILGERIANF